MPKRSKKEAAGGGAGDNGAGAEAEPEAEPEAEAEEAPSGRPRKRPRPPLALAPPPGCSYSDPPERLEAPGGAACSFRVASWNVAGLRAWAKGEGLAWVGSESPHVLCLQETKCGGGAVPGAVRGLPGLPHQFWAQGPPGQSGVGLLAREPPLRVTYGIGDPEHDAEGRVLTAEFPALFVVSAYAPNAGRGLRRLPYRLRWDAAFRAHLLSLDATKPVVVAGDLNVAHGDLDLRHPRANRRSPGFTDEERASFSALLAEGFLDSFRALYPEAANAFTFWTRLGAARARNAGWRLDYFVVSRRLRGALCDSKIRAHVQGSDHCPISLLLAI
ncbi:DNA repair nuclease/redox regulator APEX1 [Eudromia elegans]